MSSRGCLRSHDVVGLVRSLVWVAVVSLSVACTDTTEGSADGGRKLNVGDGSRGARCASDDDCSDGLFCDGVERCLPSSASADSHGCLRGDPPCTPMQTCDEVRDQCLSNCDRTPDADGDGHRATNCGGDDCDDADPQRFPGNTEVCDTMRPGHDEDCDPATYANPMTADGDRDRDGYVNAQCCNADRNGNRFCGPDCNDANPNAHPTAPEVCNGVDDNCNRMTDEGLSRTFYRDADGDGHGNPGGPTMVGCNPPPGFVANNGDCDDGTRNRNPGAPEVCDGVDNNCNRSVDEALPVNECYADADRDNSRANQIVTRTCAPCPPGTLTASAQIDCCDRDANVRPGQAEYFSGPGACGGFDFNCDGREEQRWQAGMCYCNGLDGFAWRFGSAPCNGSAAVALCRRTGTGPCLQTGGVGGTHGQECR